MQIQIEGLDQQERPAPCHGKTDQLNSWESIVNSTAFRMAPEIGSFAPDIDKIVEDTSQAQNIDTDISTFAHVDRVQTVSEVTFPTLYLHNPCLLYVYYLRFHHIYIDISFSDFVEIRLQSICRFSDFLYFSTTDLYIFNVVSIRLVLSVIYLAYMCLTSFTEHCLADYTVAVHCIYM